MSVEQIENYLNLADQKSLEHIEAHRAYFENVLIAAKVTMQLLEEDEREGITRQIELCERRLEELSQGFSHAYQYYGTLDELEEEISNLRSHIEELIFDE